MKRKYLTNLIIVSIFLIFVVWKYLSITREADELYEKLQSEYSRLRADDSINNVILKTYYPSEWRGAGFFQYITLDDSRMFSIKIDHGITSEDIYYGNIAKQGTRIFKSAGSDTLIVFKDEKEVLFLIKNNEDEMNPN